MMRFNAGDVVEIEMQEDGFYDSYYEAVVVRRLRGRYVVEYLSLLTDDETGPLVEEVNALTVRPVPPYTHREFYEEEDTVDVYVNDGWWFGRVVGYAGAHYTVMFDHYREYAIYHISRLRVHRDFAQGQWFPP